PARRLSALRAVARLPALAAGLAGFVRIELVRGALAMRGLPALAAGGARLIGVELVRGPFLVGRLAAAARDLALALRVHRREATRRRLALAAFIAGCHGSSSVRTAPPFGRSRADADV